MKIKGNILTVRYYNPENGWVAGSIQIEQGRQNPIQQTVNITGTLGEIKAGTCIEAEGEFQQTKYGPSFKVSSWHESRPSDREGIIKYLSSGLIKNIGPVYAEAIVNTFGDNTLYVLDNEPERLKEVHGIGEKRVQSFIDAVREHNELREIMIWLKRYDIPNGLAVKIFKEYKGNAIDILEENPYRLADDLGGVGFKKADSVAKLIGISDTSPFRIRSGILAVLKDQAAEGNTCLPVHILQDLATGPNYLNIPAAYFSETLSDPLFLNVDVILNDDDTVALNKYHYAEKGIAHRIIAIKNATQTLFDAEPDFGTLEKETGLTYSDEQREAIRASANDGVLVITGGPGTGKTATTNAIIHELERKKLSYRLAAPTGRAAKRMNEVTRRPASTIHRLLEYQQGSFLRNEDCPLTEDVVIIDEVSMIDTLLMNSLLKAIPEGCRLILVGDVDQLPSVGAGCVLRDLIESNIVKTVRLTTIYRQAQDSRIVTNAHKINKGLAPTLDAPIDADFKFIEIESTQDISAFISDLVAHQIPEIDGIKSKDIQVLCPMRRDWDPIGSTVLNRRLQQLLNPDGEVILKRGVNDSDELRVGDRIMQIRNNYDKDIYNGDVGFILEKLNPDLNDEAIMRVVFDGRFINLKKSECQDIELAYACTIHKSQGSEYKAVVMPIHESQFIMLKRNLLYTGVTRAKKLCVLVGTKKAVFSCINTEDTKKRYTNLKEKIKLKNNA